MLARLHYLGGNLVFIQPVNPLDPGFGVGAPVDPGYGHPAGGHPDQGLPVMPGHPGHELPTAPGAPDNTLPTPPLVAPGLTLVVVRGPTGKWHYATLQPGVAPIPLPIPPPMAQPKA